MASKNNYPIHSDFKKFPVINIKFNTLVIGALNLMLRVTRGLQKRSFNLRIDKAQAISSDNTPVNLIVMTPHDVKPDAPVLVYYHGGGFAMTYSSLHLGNAEHYANETGCVTVFVQYRLGPKDPFPCGFNDAYAALEWVVNHAEKLGVDVGRIAVGGDSAGGALAAGVAQKARDQKLVDICGQLLIYPVMDSRCSTPSATDFVDTPLWNAISNRAMWEMYLSAYPAGELPPYAAPGQGDLSKAPTTYIETAEFDPLRDEALAYVEALIALDNHPVVHQTQGTIHGYDGNAASEISQTSVKKRLDFLHQIFNN